MTAYLDKVKEQLDADLLDAVFVEFLAKSSIHP